MKNLFQRMENKNMGLTINKIYEAIEFLEYHGYKVFRDRSGLVDKWVAFHWHGMQPIMHGQIQSVSLEGTYVIKCKNGSKRWIDEKDILKFFDDKKECYEYR